MNIGIIGCGVMGGTHARAYRALGQAVAAVADVDGARAERLAREFGCRAYGNIDAMLDSEALDAVSLCTPTFDHLKSIERIAARGIPLLCEKPLALTLSDARCAYRIVKKSGIPFRLGFKMRYESVYQEAVRLVRSDEIGPVRHIFISHFQPLSEPAWYMDNGVTMELLIHSIDMANLLMGGAPEKVSMESMYLLGKAGEDQAALSLYYAQDRCARIVGGYMPQYPPVRGRHDFVFQFLCERGYAAGKRGGGIELFSPGRIERIEPAEGNAFEQEIRDFLSLLGGEKAGGATLADALNVQRVLSAAKQSEASGAPVALEGTEE